MLNLMTYCVKVKPWSQNLEIYLKMLHCSSNVKLIKYYIGSCDPKYIWNYKKLCTTQTNAHGKDKYDVTWIIRAPCKEGQALLRDIKKPSIITKCNHQLKATKVCSTHMYYSCVLFETIKLCTTWIYTLGENNDEVTFVIRASCKVRLHMDISIWHHLSHMTPNLNI